jgi:hypothetical protein
MKINRQTIARLSALALVAASGASRAAGTTYDTASVTEALTGAGAAIAVVGAAYLAMSVGAKVFKWIKSAL